MKKYIKRIPFLVAIYLLLIKLGLKVLFLKDYFLFKSKNKEVNFRFVVKWKDRYLCLSDKTRNTVFDIHYIYHTAWQQES